VRHALEKLGEALVGEPAAEEQRGLDRADRGVHGQAHLRVRQVGPQRGEQVHPLFGVVPLCATQPAALTLGQRADLPMVNGERVVVGQGHLDMITHQH